MLRADFHSGLPMPFLVFAFLISLSVCSQALVPAAVSTATLRLDDGSEHQVQLLGSRSNPYAQLSDQRLVVEQEGVYYIAELVNGRTPVATDEVFGYRPGYQPQEKAPPSSIQTVRAQANPPIRSPYRYAGGNFDQPVVVVRVAFSDQGFEYSDYEVAQRIFGPSNSVQSYFLENSYQQFRVIPAQESYGVAGDGIIRLTLNTPHPDFGAGYGSASAQLTRSAMAALSNQMNLAAYDKNGDRWLDPSELGLVILVAGFEQAYASTATTHPRVWAHKSSVSAENVGGYWLSEYTMFGEQHEQHLATVGIMAHELGHLLLDLPDLYDSIGIGEGISRLGLMSFGTWNSGGGDAGDQPSHLVAWAKEFLGFAQATTDTGGVSLGALSAGPDFLRIDLDDYRHGRRVLIENRQQTGYDAGLPGAGLLITEVDDWRGFGVLSSLTQGHSERLVSALNDVSGSDLVTNSGGALIERAASVLLADGQVQLASVNAAMTADLTSQVNTQPRGFALGYDEVPANGSWGDYGSTAYAVVTVPMTADMLSLDGVDFFAHGSGELDVGIYTNLTRFSAEGNIARQTFNVQAGWNRLLFDRPVNPQVDTVYLQLISEPSGSHAPFLVDLQGTPSGLTQVKERREYDYLGAEFDLSAKLLVASSDQPVNRAPASSSGNGTSGGALPLWWCACLLLMGLRALRNRS